MTTTAALDTITDWQNAAGIYSLWVRTDSEPILLARAKGSDFWTQMFNGAKQMYGAEHVYYTWTALPN